MWCVYSIWNLQCCLNVCEPFRKFRHSAWTWPKAWADVHRTNITSKNIPTSRISRFPRTSKNRAVDAHQAGKRVLQKSLDSKPTKITQRSTSIAAYLQLAKDHTSKPDGYWSIKIQMRSMFRERKTSMRILCVKHGGGSIMARACFAALGPGQLAGESEPHSRTTTFYQKTIQEE